MKEKIVFILTCLVSILAISSIVHWVSDLIYTEWPWYYYSGTVMCVGLYLVAWLYPNKKYDTNYDLAGMHRHALGWGSYFIYGDIIRPFRDVRGISYELGWTEALTLLAPVLVAILIYKLMLMTLSIKKNKIEQGAAGNPLPAE